MIGGKDFGLKSQMAFIDGKYDLVELSAAWFDRYLKNEDSGILPREPVQVFITGENRWRSMNSWPSDRCEYKTLYFSKDNNLTESEPAYESDSYSFNSDPENPVPVNGGALLMPPVFQPGVQDQRKIEERPDVLSFTSGPMKEDFTAAGRVKVILHAHSESHEADYVARLIDVAPDETAENITDGILRISGSRKDEQIEIDLWSAGHVFKKDHSVRVDICGSCFPRWDMAPALKRFVGKNGNKGAEYRIFHGSLFPSRTVIQVL